jgi:hypothetical protein
MADAARLQGRCWWKGTARLKIQARQHFLLKEKRIRGARRRDNPVFGSDKRSLPKSALIEL